MKMKKPGNYWGTKSEIEFLRRLGTYNGKSVDREKLLKGYLEGCRKRERWGYIEKEVVISEAQRMLNACSGQA
jgi:hypothetical protein